MMTRANAIFGMTTAPGHGLELTGLGPLLQEERRGNLTLQTRSFGDGSALYMGGLVLGGPAPVLLCGSCARDLSNVKDLRKSLSSGPSGEYSMVVDWSDSILAARDPLGARPLYQGAIEGVSAVSSIPSLLSGLAMKPEPAVPGDIVTLKGGSLKSKRYAPAIGGSTFRGTLGQAAARLGRLLGESLRVRLDGTGEVAVSFSGGLDSSVLAAACSRRHKVLLVSVFAEGSKDSATVGGSAEGLGFELHKVRVGRADLDRALAALALPGAASPMDRALAAGFYVASSEARSQGLGVLLAGQGADEIFGGYNRHLETATADPRKLIPQLVSELPQLEAGLRRDELAINRGGCEASFPYADFPLARLALNLPPQFLISRGERKVVLRELAKKLGVPGSTAEAPKKAFQYSSGIQGLLAD